MKSYQEYVPITLYSINYPVTSKVKVMASGKSGSADARRASFREPPKYTHYCDGYIGCSSTQN